MRYLSRLAAGAVVLAAAATPVGLTGVAHAVPAATCTPTGFVRDNINMTAALIDPPGTVSGEVDATGCNIGVYYDHGHGAVSGANVHGANYFGVVVNGDVNPVSVDVLNSQIHDIGETPLNGTQHGVGIYYRDLPASGPGGGASGTIKGNTLSKYQKGGIVANGTGTNVKVQSNTVTGVGPVDYIAQNGIQIGYGAKAQVLNNTVSANAYTGTNFASSGGILVVGGECYGDGLAYTTNTDIVGNIVTNNDVGIYLSNAPGPYPSGCGNAPATSTNIKAINNTISDNATTNISGNGATGYQAGISDQGNGDKLINNTISGAGYQPCQPNTCLTIDAGAPYTANAKIHATK